ncbi:MAG: T9SS type A sorting domain-containing protein [Bacteroidetes bacterium]|nr:T9SS type A sorting domain-containing protein [Bacteroidota bacterium]
MKAFGSVDTLTYCNNTMGPYHIGMHNYPLPWSCNNGGYTFTFTPPINELFINFGSIDGSSLDSEVVKLYVNGLHYAIPFPGTANACQPLAILTSDGDVTSPSYNGCGWENTKISGMIDSITVLDSIIHGCPMGAVFSLSLCNWPVSTTNYALENKGVSIYPNPASSEINIEYECKSEGVFVLYNSLGQQVYSCILPEGNNKVYRSLPKLVDGLYNYRCKFTGCADSFGKLLIE